jgi:AcrR family transcriptional regulator
MAEAQPSRVYDSTGRLARAAENRERILRSAHDLFVANGFAGTTISAVANAAQVSNPTVYAGFETKAKLLRRCIEVALAGDDDDVPVPDRPLSRWVFDTSDPRELLSRYAVMMTQLAASAGSIYEVLVRAADAEPELAALVAEFEGQRLRASMMVAEAIQERGGLAPGLTVAQARDAVFVCNAPELYAVLTRKRRWSTKRYTAWARSTLIKLVIEAPIAGEVPTPPTP